MYHNSPKVMMKVELLGEKDLRVTLLLVDKYFNEHYKDSNLFLANDGFTVYRGSIFVIFQKGSIHIPKNFLVGNNFSEKVSFISDKERYEYLKRLQRALVEWSKSKFWDGFTDDSRIKLTFRKEVWLLF